MLLKLKRRRAWPGGAACLPLKRQSAFNCSRSPPVAAQSSSRLDQMVQVDCATNEPLGAAKMGGPDSAQQLRRDLGTLLCS